MKLYRTKTITYLIISITLVLIGAFAPSIIGRIGIGVIAVVRAFLGGYDSCVYDGSSETNEKNSRD